MLNTAYDFGKSDLTAALTEIRLTNHLLFSRQGLEGNIITDLDGQLTELLRCGIVRRNSGFIPPGERRLALCSGTRRVAYIGKPDQGQLDWELMARLHRFGRRGEEWPGNVYEE